MAVHIETWLQLMMCGKSTLTMEILRLLHTAAESSSQVHQAALECAVLPALADLLSDLIQGQEELQVDSAVTTAACDLLDLFLVKAGLERSAASATADDSCVNSAQHVDVQVIISRELAAQLSTLLVSVVGLCESCPVTAAAVTCLYHMVCMEDDPVPLDTACATKHHISEKQSGESGQQSLGHAAAMNTNPQHSPHRRHCSGAGQISGSEAVRGTDQELSSPDEQCPASDAQHCLKQLLHNGAAVEGLIVATATMVSDGPAGTYWPHAVPALAVLSWVAAAFVRAADGQLQSRPTAQHVEAKGKLVLSPLIDDNCMATAGHDD
jgi:hypothetical protein